MKTNKKFEKGFYKIRDKNTGLFKCAGQYPPVWSKNGKVWNEQTLKLAITNHFSYHRNRKSNTHKDWEIVRFESIEKEVFDFIDVYVEDN
jgi:hypothetical protein